MPLAVTHVLTTVILVGLYRDYVTKHKRYFTLHTVMVAGIAAILADIDIVLRMFSKIFNFQVPFLLSHGGITHTPIFAFIFIIPGLILWKNRKHRPAMYFYVIAFAILLHIFLDYFLGGGNHAGVMWLYPFSTQAWKIHLLSKFGLSSLPAALDAIILLVWLWYIEVKHKISDFV
jgi:membrane-bound metal-dependent hydrolase YbcI (DUF457 family)